MPNINRFACVFFILFVTPIEHVHAEESFVREWQSEIGTTVLAAFVNIDNQTNQVRLRKIDDGKEIALSLDRLSQVDQQYVLLQPMVREERDQFEKVSQHLEGLRTAPQTTIDILKAIAVAHPNSPYASVWGAVASGAGMNKVDDAIKQCKEAINRIKAQRKLDGSRHSRTLLSAYNNLAVCNIKNRNADEAARLFLEALALVDRTPPVLLHNMRFLSEISGVRGTLKLDDKYKSKLTIAIASRNLEDPKKKLQLGWYYSLDFDVPSALENELSVSGVHPPDHSLELIASGTGVVCAPGYVVTVNSAGVHPYRSASLATIAIPNGASSWILKPAQRVFSTQPRKRITSGSDSVADSVSNWSEKTNYNQNQKTSESNQSFGIGSSVGGSGATTANSNFNFGNSEANTRTTGNRAAQGTSNTRTLSGTTNYTLTHPTDGTAEAELAILQIDGLRIEPCLFADEFPTPNSKVEILGYQRGPNMLKDGQQKFDGNVLNVLKPNQFSIDTPILGGNRGSLCFDRSHRVIGFTWKSGQKPIGGYCYTTSALKNWFASTAQTADLKFADSTDNRLDEKRLHDATVPVLVWGRRSDVDMSNPIYNQFYNDDNLIDLFVIRDDWCFACGGDGKASCPTCFGQAKIKSGMRTDFLGNDPTTGQPITRTIPNMVTCPTCNGQKQILCTQCQRGRLPGNAKLDVAR